MSDEHRTDGVTWLGHATCVIDLGGVRLVTDPLLGRHAGVLRRRDALAPEPGHWRGSAAALVSHLHHDHAHLASLRSVGAVALSAPANAHWLETHGVPAHHLGPQEWWSPAGATHVRVRTVPAVHGHRPMPHRPNATTGFVVVSEVEGRTTRVWFAGDTEAFPEMAHLADLAGGPLDLALVPIGGWGPRLSGGHLDPVQAARVCRTVGAVRAVPIHWGTLHAPLGRNLPRGWMDRGGEAFVAALHREAPACEPVLLQPGGRIAL